MTESGWDDPYERATVDALLDWKADRHTCGHSMTTALQGAPGGLDEDDLIAGYRVCLPCLVLERERAGMAHADKEQRERGINPEAWRLWHVEIKPEAAARMAAQPDDS